VTWLAREGYITINGGIRLFFHAVGSGPKAIIPNGIYFSGDLEWLSRERTLVFYDVRNRGRSDTITDPSQLAGGIHNDVDDLEAVRLHFGIDRIDAIAHSYMGVMLALYAIKYPDHVNHLVQIAPMQPDAAKQYPSHLTGADSTLTEAWAKIAKLQQELRSAEQPQDPVEACEKFWELLAPVYVVNPADAVKVKFGRCELPNERNFMSYWMSHIQPSIQSLHFSAVELAKVKAPVLIIHGIRDRNAPYGGGRDWASLFPDARLVTIENAAHASWIDTPERVAGSIRSFLNGQWPEGAENVLPD
jgi:pimeloyl-ACP methyl ester carboxylesterase